MNGDPVPAGDAPVVSFRNLSLRYKKTIGLDDVSLDIPSRKLIGLIGPDGVGKSTLLSLVTGAHAMQEGTLEVLGAACATPDTATRSVPGSPTCRRVWARIFISH